MFTPFYNNFKQQKRNFQEDSSSLYVPILKKTRLYESLNDISQSNFDHHSMNKPYIQTEQPASLEIMEKGEYFPAVFVASNESFESNSFELNNFKYMPDLNAAQNPYYYEYNKLLFELYRERVRRSKSQNPVSSQPLH